MKKTVIVFALILGIIFTGCNVAIGEKVTASDEIANDTSIIEVVPTVNEPTDIVVAPMVSENSTVEEIVVDRNNNIQDNNQNSTSMVKNDYPFYRVVDVATFVEYLENNMPNCSFEIQGYDTNYEDDYFGTFISEYAYIVGTFEESFDFLTFSICFVENEIVDFSVTVNVPNGYVYEDYEKFVTDILFEIGVSYSLTEGQLVEYEKVFTDFDSYEKNIYGNKEMSATFDDVTALSVIFEGGKDFQFKGVTYFFVTSILM